MSATFASKCLASLLLLLLVVCVSVKFAEAQVHRGLPSLADDIEIEPVHSVDASLEVAGSANVGPTRVKGAVDRPGNATEPHKRALASGSSWTLSSKAYGGTCVDFGAWDNYVNGQKNGGVAYDRTCTSGASWQQFQRSSTDQIFGQESGSYLVGTQCLDMGTGSAGTVAGYNAYPVYHWTCHSGSNQRWTWTTTSNGIVLKNYYNGQCLMALSDSRLYVTDCGYCQKYSNCYFNWAYVSQGPTPAPGPTPTPGPSPSPGSCGDAWIAQAVAAHNSLRAQGGRRALTCDSRAVSIATAKSAEMCRTNNFSHDGFTTRCSQAGYGTCAENIAYNFDTSSQAGNVVTTQWRNSPGHYTNIMNNAYGRVGLGYYRCGNGRVYWTALFGA